MVLCLPPAYLEMRMRAGRRVARVGRGSARHPSPVKLGHRASYVMVALMVLGALALAVPLTTLGYWLMQGQSAGRGYTDVWRAITGTASFSVFGALLTGILAVPLVWLSVRHRGGLAVLAERLPYVAHGLPGVVVALALVFMSIQLVPSLYQTTVLLLLAYVILFLPLAQSSLRASMELASPQFENIARSLGRRPLHAFLSVTLPVIAPGVGAALALVMLEIVRELTATLMLAPTGAITLATEVWSHTSNAEYAAAAPFAALLVAFSVLPVYVFTRRLLRYGEAQ
jgi:iron(III) transport system permease protein